MPEHPTKVSGIDLIAAERERQINEEQWSPDHDDEHDEGELATAAACYAAREPIYVERRDRRRVQFVDPWPWDFGFDKRSRSSDMRLRLRDLVKAGALIAAEIDRIQRQWPDDESAVDRRQRG